MSMHEADVRPRPPPTATADSRSYLISDEQIAAIKSLKLQQ